jgi:hypothetical protein
MRLQKQIGIMDVFSSYEEIARPPCNFASRLVKKERAQAVASLYASLNKKGADGRSAPRFIE